MESGETTRIPLVHVCILFTSSMLLIKLGSFIPDGQGSRDMAVRLAPVRPSIDKSLCAQ